MYNAKKEFILTKENILNYVSEERIFSYYLCVDVNPRKTYYSPFRQDNHPGCKFYYNREKVLKFHDFAAGLNEDCIGIVKLLFSCNYHEALLRIAKDFNLIDGTEAKRLDIKYNTEDDNKVFYYSTKKYTEEDVKYWKEYELSGKDLVHNDKLLVKSVQTVFINDKRVYTYNSRDIGFVYEFPDGTVKFYFPYRKLYRFLTNSKYIQGLNLLPDYSPINKGEQLIITKSYKDVICLKKFGIDAIAPQNEKIVIDEDIILKLQEKYYEVYTLFDYDRTGIELAREYLYAYGIPPLLIRTGEKDFSGYLKQHKTQKTQNLINYARKRLDS